MTKYKKNKIKNKYFICQILTKLLPINVFNFINNKLYVISILTNIVVILIFF
jgi:hypothetical protein